MQVYGRQDSFYFLCPHPHQRILGLGQRCDSAVELFQRNFFFANFEDVMQLDFSRDIYLYSQTTKSLEEFQRIVEYIEQHISADAVFQRFDTICRQVANRISNITSFAAKHDLVLFVCGRKSSNGKVLFNECKNVNSNTYLIEDADEIQLEWLQGVKTVGICGATSTPKWLMEECRDFLIQQS